MGTILMFQKKSLLGRKSGRAFFIVAGGGPLMDYRVFPTLSSAFFMEECDASR